MFAHLDGMSLRSSASHVVAIDTPPIVPSATGPADPVLEDMMNADDGQATIGVVDVEETEKMQVLAQVRNVKHVRNAQVLLENMLTSFSCHSGELRGNWQQRRWTDTDRHYFLDGVHCRVRGDGGKDRGG